MIVLRHQRGGSCERELAARPLRAGALLVGATLMLSGCGHDAIIAPATRAAPSYLAVALLCTADPAAARMSCAQQASGVARTASAAIQAVRTKVGSPSRTATVSARDVIIGGQGLYVQLAWANSAYNATAQTYQTYNTVQDLTTEPFGTGDGVTADTLGIRVFFDSLPVATQGTGTVTVANASGTATYTSTTPQPYFQYAGLLPSNGTTAPVEWVFNVPSTVTEFQYYVYVITKMPAENVQAIADIPAHAFDLLAVGQAHTCAVRPGTTGNAGTYAYCWGFDNTGAIGTATTQTAVTIPLGVLGYESFATVTSGTDFSCALAGSQAYCWGDNSRGEVGDGTTTDRLEPTAVAGGFSFSQIAAGTEFACGLQSSGTAYCWGANNFGQLGNGTTTDLTAPTSGKAVGSGAESFVSIAVGAYHACGYTSTGAVYCWGGNAAGALGQPVDSVPHPTPTVVGAVTVQSIAAGDNFTCGVAVSTGQVECWGANLYGGLGDGTTTSRSTPEMVSGGVTFETVTAGAFHACAATAAGVTYCWGDNSVGQLGTGTSTGTDLYVPTPVSGSYAFNTVDAGFGHTCALTGSGSTLCWGDNSVGELGNGTTSSTPSTTPVAVDLP